MWTKIFLSSKLVYQRIMSSTEPDTLLPKPHISYMFPTEMTFKDSECFQMQISIALTFFMWDLCKFLETLFILCARSAKINKQIYKQNKNQKKRKTFPHLIFPKSTNTQTKDDQAKKWSRFPDVHPKTAMHDVFFFCFFFFFVLIL